MRNPWKATLMALIHHRKCKRVEPEEFMAAIVQVHQGRFRPHNFHDAAIGQL